MSSTRITNPAGLSDYQYVVNATQNGETKTSSTSSIFMYLNASDIYYDSTAAIAKNTNKAGSEVVILGTFTVTLDNPTGTISDDMYLTLEATNLTGTLGGTFTINKIGSNTSCAVNTPYLVGQVDPSATPPTPPGQLQVEIQIGYASNGASKPGDTITFTLTGYEDVSGSHEAIASSITITITTVYADLASAVTLVTALNAPITATEAEPVYVVKGDTVYYLTTITNSGNADTLANTVLEQTLDPARFYPQTVSIGYGPVLDTSAPITWAHTDSKALDATGKFTLTIADIIDQTGGTYVGKYYVRVTAEVKQ